MSLAAYLFVRTALTGARRTYGELEILFDQRVSARKFSSTHVDQFAGAQVEPKVVQSTVEHVDSKKGDDDMVAVSKA